MASPRVAFLLPNLHCGGAEKLTVLLAHHFCRTGFGVDLVLRQRQGDLLAEAPAEARVVALDTPRVRQALRPLVRYLKNERPDALVASLWPMTAVASVANRLAGRPTRLMVSDHNMLSRQAANTRGWRYGALRAGIRSCYPLADVRHAVSGGVADDLSRLGRLPRQSFTVIHNPVIDDVAIPTSTGDPWPDRPGTRVLAIGTLKEQKDYPTLLGAFAAFSAKRPAQLAVLGDGPLRESLAADVRRAGLEDRVHFAGYVADPHRWYAHADLFALSSSYEGFGNVIVEALWHGLPVVCTDCPSGPSDILVDGRFGRLVPVGDKTAMADAMHNALAAPVDSDRLRSRAEDFTVSKIGEQYRAILFPEVTATGAPEPATTGRTDH